MPTEPTLLRVLVTRRHWQRFETFSAQFSRAARALAEQEDEPGISRVTVSSRQFERWYAGKVKTVPHPDACRILEEMFGYPVDQLLGSAFQERVPETLEPARREILLVRSDAVAPTAIWRPDRSDGVNGDDFSHTAASTDYLANSDPERMIAMAARRALQFGAAADASNVGSDSLELLRGETGRLAVAYLQQPLSEILGDIAALQDHTFSLLEGRQRPRETRDLYVVGGLASGMLAKAAHDLRDPQLAMTHARTALLCARNAEQAALTAWVHGLQSLITYWADRPREALQYAQSGQEIPGITGTVGIWLASLEARAWSALGNGAASRDAIERASNLREHAIADDLDSVGGMCYFSHPRQLYYAADASASLAGPHDKEIIRSAISRATMAVTAYEDALPDEKSFSDEAGSRADLALALIRAGEIEGASEAIRPVLNLPLPLRIHGVVTSVTNVHHAITANAIDSPDGSDLQEEIEEYCRTPAALLR